jgi:acetylornithine deacetylase
MDDVLDANRRDGHPDPAAHMTATDPARLLAELIAFRTDIDGDERPLADHLARMLRARHADEVIVEDAARPRGKKSSWVYARFGKPRAIVNVHLDTVPPNADWKSDPFTARIDGDRLYGLGAADTKGSLAAILCALEEATPKDFGILFSGDEETSGASVNAFVASEHRAGIERAIVCEPTSLRAGTKHRGITSFEVAVSGPGGHSSRADHVLSPIAVLSRLGVALDDWARARRNDGPEGFEGTCMNLAQLEGGVAFNVIPAAARLTASLRPAPGTDMPRLRTEIEALARDTAPEGTLRYSRDNDPFATRTLAAFEPLLGEIATKPIDLGFWTEAAVFAAAGVDAVVFGAGDIAQAHAPNEWVEIPELHRARDIFRAMFSIPRRG